MTTCRFCTRPAYECGICLSSECRDKALAPKIAAILQRGAEHLAEIERKEREAAPSIDWQARALAAETEAARQLTHARARAKAQGARVSRLRRGLKAQTALTRRAYESRSESDREARAASRQLSDVIAYAHAECERLRASEARSDEITLDVAMLAIDRWEMARDAMRVGLAECERLRVGVATVTAEMVALILDTAEAECERQALAAIVRAYAASPAPYDDSHAELTCCGEHSMTANDGDHAPSCSFVAAREWAKANPVTP